MNLRQEQDLRDRDDHLYAQEQRDYYSSITPYDAIVLLADEIQKERALKEVEETAREVFGDTDGPTEGR